MKVIAVHLLNDYSGSPKVLKQLLMVWTKKNINTELYVCGGKQGFLTDIPKVTTHHYWYRFAKNPLLRFLFLMSSQLILLIKLLFKLKKTDILYINTVLPFGAAIAGKIIGCKIMYHIHETSMKPKILKLFLFGIVKWSASEVVYVSNFLANQEPLKIKTTVIYNVLEKDFLKRCNNIKPSPKDNKIVLMICSLKAYKGVNEFLQLAHLNQKYTFKLVVNASENEIINYFKMEVLPENLIIYPTQKDTHRFYKEASIVLNLSNPRVWIETFGLTILEAMAYGLPTIVPPVGGVVELVKEGKNGFLIDSKNIPLLSKKLNEVLQNTALYQKMSGKAIEYSRFFCEDYFENESTRILSN